MQFIPLLRSKIDNPLEKIFVQAFLWVFLSIAITGFIYERYLAQEWIYHSVIELFYLFFMIALFLRAWFTYDYDSELNRLIGFGFLCVAILQISHIYFFVRTFFFGQNNLELAHNLYVWGNLIEGILIYLWLELPEKFILKISKGYRFFTALFLGLGTAYLQIFLEKINAFSKYYHLSGDVLTGILFLFFIFILYKFITGRNVKDALVGKFIFIALILGIVIHLSAMFNDIRFFDILSHMLRAFYAYYLFKALFLSPVTYQYKQMTGVIDELPIGLMTFNKHLKLSYINKTAQDLVGYTLKDIKGMSVEQISKLFYGENAPKPFLRKVAETSVPVRNKIINVKSKDRSEARLILNAVKLENGGFVNFISDAKAEQKLENLQLQTETILNAISNMIIILDKNNKILMCNRSFENTVEISSDKIIGLTLEQLHSLLNCQITEDSLGDASSDQVKITEEYKQYSAEFRTRTGERRQILLYIAPIYNVEGELIGWIRIASDVTKLKKEAEKLRQQEKLAVLGQMAAGLVHEIKNPLTTIKGFSQMLSEKISDEQIRQYLSIIEETSNDLDKIVGDFLSFAKPRQPLLKEILVSEVIRSIKMMLETIISSNGIVLNIEFAEKEKAVLGDENQIKQVVLNIVKNAIEAMSEQEKPKLNINTIFSESMKEMVIAISDNGKGMSPEETEKIGVPFHTTKEKGTGLGMSISYQIIREHNGRIKIESSLGKGTTFYVALPCKAG